MSEVQQLDLFSIANLEPNLNGVYYERSTGLFVSYVQGRRHFEVAWAECLGDKAWKEKTKRERGI